MATQSPLYLKYNRYYSDVSEYWTDERLNSLVPFDSIIDCTPHTNVEHRGSIPTGGPVSVPNVGGVIGDENASTLCATPPGALDQESADIRHEGKNVLPAGDYLSSEVRDTVTLPRSRKMTALNAAEESIKSLPAVEDAKLDTLPYQSIGRVIASKDKIIDVPLAAVQATQNVTVSNIEPNMLQATAFYIGEECTVEGKDMFKVLTVAHIFDNTDNHHYGFIPSSSVSISNSYVYRVYGWVTHPRYNPKAQEAKYDISVVYVLPQQSETGEIIKPPWKPLKLVVAQYTPSHRYIWKVIGYPCASTSSRTLKELEGRYIPAYEIEDYESATVEMRNRHLVENHVISLKEIQGMSGGPWILMGTNDEVSGIQSRVKRGVTKDCISPYFRASVLNELGLGYIKKPIEHMV